MSVQAISWVLEYSQARLAARLVLLSIANHADARGLNAFPSVSTIAREAHVEDRTVQLALRELLGLGEITIDIGAGPRGRHLYQLTRMGENFSPVGVNTFHPRGENDCSAIRKNRPLTVQNHPPIVPPEKPPGLKAREAKERAARIAELEEQGKLPTGAHSNAQN